MIADAIAAVIGKVIDRAWPDEAKKAEALLELEKLRQSGELQQIMGQLEVNRAEAAHPDRFVAGWRPFIGWVCGTALAWHYVGSGLLVWLLALAGRSTIMPTVDLGDLIVILLGMLGLGGLRTAEKVKGVVR